MKKRFFLILMLSVLPLMANAQRETGFFFGAGAGMNFGFDGLKYVDRVNSHNGAGYAGEFFLGGWVSPAFGIRAGYQGFGISDTYTDFGRYKYQYIHGDLLFRPHRNIAPYIHAGYVNIVNPSAGGGAGILLPIHLGKRVSIVPDLKLTVYGNQAYGLDNKNLAMTLSATVGLAVRLGGKSTPKRTPTVTPLASTPQVIHDTIRVPQIITEVKERIIHDTVYVEIPPETISGMALFDYGKDELRPEILPELEKIANWFKNHPNATAVIEGHTDNSGSDKFNQGLSERRAWAVYGYLVRQGISPSRLQSFGYGESRPIATNETAEGRQKNRRVEIHVVN